jgi:hypothetical protein
VQRITIVLFHAAHIDCDLTMLSLVCLAHTCEYVGVVHFHTVAAVCVDVLETDSIVLARAADTLVNVNSTVAARSERNTARKRQRTCLGIFR